MSLGNYLLNRSPAPAAAALFLTLLPMLGIPSDFFLCVLVGFITLGRGARAGLALMPWIALPSLALLYLHRFGVFDLMLLRALFVWMFAALLHRNRSWSQLFDLGVGIGVVVVISLHYLIPDLASKWTTLLMQYLEVVTQFLNITLPKADQSQLIKVLIPFATGLSAFSVLLFMMLSLFIARCWLSRIHESENAKREFLHFKPSKALGVVVTLGALALLSKNAVVMDVFPVLLLPFFVNGLSVLHYMVSQQYMSRVFLIVAYVMLFILPIYVVIVVACLGYIDTWVYLEPVYVKLFNRRGSE